MNYFMELAEKVNSKLPSNSKLAEAMMDEYTEEVFSWWGNWHEDTQEEILKEYCDFYKKMGWKIPHCLKELI